MSLNNEVEVGKLKKHYSGFMREMYSNADKFSVSCNFIRFKSLLKQICKKDIFLIILVPIDMSVATKATLLGALFLIVISILNFFYGFLI